MPKLDPHAPAFRGSDGRGGLTKRELFAALALVGNIASYEEDGTEYDPAKHASVQQIAREAVEFADALIAALNEGEGE